MGLIDGRSISGRFGLWHQAILLRRRVHALLEDEHFDGPWCDLPIFLVSRPETVEERPQRGELLLCCHACHHGTRLPIDFQRGFRVCLKIERPSRMILLSKIRGDDRWRALSGAGEEQGHGSSFFRSASGRCEEAEGVIDVEGGWREPRSLEPHVKRRYDLRHQPSKTAGSGETRHGSLIRTHGGAA